LPEGNIDFSPITPSISDAQFASNVQSFKQEIFNGNICQGILSREFSTFLDYNEETLSILYKKLLSIVGADTTFMFRF
jgi:anthranilate/para-aminobenzoate synthase component I